MAKEQTPLMKQYYEIKKKYPNTILLFRMGDFFETFDEDAGITAKICGITLTKRNNGNAAASPLAGFPHHQIDTYLAKLVKAGCRVAVCEQIEDPKNKTGKIVKREVIEVVTPGVSLYDKLLDTNRNNYVASIYLLKNKEVTQSIGLAICDISTGEFLVGEINPNQIVQTIETYLPTEILYSKAQKNEIEEILSQFSYKFSQTKLEEWIFEQTFAKELMLRQFQTRNFKGFGIEDLRVGISAAGAILNYISETQKAQLPQINSLKLLNISTNMILDFATRKNLEILYTMEGDVNGSLIKILDKTLTPIGSRLFKRWINQPLNNLEKIHNRLNAVENLVENNNILERLIAILNNFGDLERLVSRISSGKSTTRDILSLANSLEKIPQIIDLFSGFSNFDDKKTDENLEAENPKSNYLKKLISKLTEVNELVKTIKSAMLEDPAINFGNGNIFRTGFNSELDSFIRAKYSGKKWISDFQDEERNSSGINSLKVSFNNVFGYFIEVTKTHSSKVPEHYERKQTLTNAERYTTPILKEFEQKILTAEYKISEIELQLFNELKQKVTAFIEQIQANAEIIAEIDCLQSFASTSLLNNYVKPIIDDSYKLEIEEGRHPVVEKLLTISEKYTPNSTNIDSEIEQIHIITGPNMAGKSCYLRQTALVVLLGQIGCFVPAKKAHFGLIDRIFTRVGAQDNITSGESTFLIEMQETAYILNNATKRSLILLDEVGRGTATFDGISIAWAIAEYLHDFVGAKTLFATHYHELNDLANRYERIENYRIEVIETNNKIIFSHKVVKGSSDHSFGIYVGKMAGLPNYVIERATEIMSDLEKTNENSTQKNKLFGDTSKIKANKKQINDSHQLSIFEFRDDILREKLDKIDINSITPIQAIQILEEMKKEK
jgi:DNA mismatch repair protein MutS